MIKGTVLKVIDYGSSRRVENIQGEVGEMVGTAEFMGKKLFRFLQLKYKLALIQDCL